MKRIVFLDFLRIFAFTSVLIGHKFSPILYAFSNDDSIHESLRFLIKLVLPLCMGGAAGVVVFFLVSGYVIIHILQNELPLEFCIKRIFRIYPLYIFAVLFQYSLMILIDHSVINFHFLIPQLLLIGDFFQAPQTLDGVEWTLRVEVLFYFFMFLMRQFKLIGPYSVMFPWFLIAMTLLLHFFSCYPSRRFLESRLFKYLWSFFIFRRIYLAI